MRGLGLLMLALALGGPISAANETQSVNSTNTDGQSTNYPSHPYANTGSDAATAREKGTPPEVGPGKAGGYLAAGIGVAALGGLFASRRRRTHHDERNPRDGRGRPFVD